MPALTPMLWFDTEAEQAAEFYTSVFPNSKIVEVTHYGSAGPRREGLVMTVAFELDGQEFVALNGGPDFSFSEAISFIVSCETQEEVDTYWETLSEGGEEGPCGWLKDKFGRVVAGDSDRASEAPRRSGHREGAARHGGDARNEEDRHRDAGAGGGASSINTADRSRVGGRANGSEPPSCAGGLRRADPFRPPFSTSAFAQLPSRTGSAAEQ